MTEKEMREWQNDRLLTALEPFMSREQPPADHDCIPQCAECKAAIELPNSNIGIKP